MLANPGLYPSQGIPHANNSFMPTCVHAGVASDPQKVARFRAMMRMRASLPAHVLQTPTLKNFTRFLLKVTVPHLFGPCHG